MKILVLNTGSSSVKYRVFSCQDGDAQDIAQGLIERIGTKSGQARCRCPRQVAQRCAAVDLARGGGLDVPNHKAAVKLMCRILSSKECGILQDLSELAGIGHRVVHGGEEFSGSILIDEAVVRGIERCCKLAPLHNPPALEGIRACAEVFAGVPQVAVFDTAFHTTIPPKAHLYPVPQYLYAEHGVRKYGFHGTSHRYVSQEALKLLDIPAENARIITCHLGNGSSIAALRGGKCVDTSMGLTPLAGVMMGTRPGDIDPYLPLFMIKELGMSVEEVDAALNKASGLLAVCGHNDVRDVERRAAAGDQACVLALEMFAYHVARFVGGYAMVLGGCDAVVFTAGIGENSASLRKRILANAGYLGCYLDEARNAANGPVISADESSCKALVIPTNEELVIATDTARIVIESESGAFVGASCQAESGL